MSERYKADFSGGLYFVTLTVAGWVDVFSRKAYIDDWLTTSDTASARKGLRFMRTAS